MGDTFLVPYVCSVWQNLCHRVGLHGRMCIYGGGAHTRWLLDVVADLPSPNIECIIDDSSDAEAVNGIVVRRPDQVAIERVSLILVSSDRWEDTLARRAGELWGNHTEIVRLYDGLPAGPYDKSDARSEALRLVARRASNVKPTRRQVVIVSDHPRSREAKIGFALRSAGWRTTLLYGAIPQFDAERFFDRAARFTDPWAALKYACEENAAAYHVMTSQDYRAAELFIRHRPGPVIIDPYDLIEGMCTEEFLRAQPAMRDEIARERFCFENADGVCCRSREAQWLADHMGNRYRRLMHFPDGCWNDAAWHGNSSPNRLHGLHVAYAGGLELAHDDARQFAAGGLNMAVAERMAEQGIHVHVFPSVNQLTSRFERLTTACVDGRDRVAPGHLHFHRPVPADGIVRELERFRFGICVFTENIVATGATWRITPAKVDTCTTNKLFDYIDAGLPIIHNAPANSLIATTVSAHGVGIDVSDWPIEHWASLLGDVDATAFDRALTAARDGYDVRRNIHVLTEFYESMHCDDGRRRAESATGANHDQVDNRRAGHRPALV